MVKKDKLVSVKVPPALYKTLQKYADDTGIENVSTALRHLVTKAMKGVKRPTTRKLMRYSYLEGAGCKSFMKEASTTVYVKLEDVEKLIKGQQK